MQKKTKHKFLKLRLALRNKEHNIYRLIIINDETFSEIFSYRLTKQNTLVLFGVVSIFLMLLAYSLIAYTPLKQYVIPDYPKIEERTKIIENALQIDSLETTIKQYEQQLQLFRTIVNGDEPPQYLNTPSDTTKDFSNISFERSIEDSLLRQEVQKISALNVNFQEGTYTNPKYSNLFFFPPVKGIVTNTFSSADNNFATSIAAPKNSVIQSVLGGIVILDTWNAETGYTIIVQHSNNLISVYKHNSKLLKKSGDRVEAGEGIAIIGFGTSISKDNGYLHFELWYEGKPVNSEDFIVY